MKRFLKFCKENRIIIALLIIVIGCFVTMGVVLYNYFYTGTKVTKYGNRLEGQEKVSITDNKIKDISSKVLKNKKVKDIDIIIEGKIIYTYLTFNTGLSLVDAQTIAMKTLDDYSEDEKKFYDFHFNLFQEKTDKSDGFLISGAKNVNGSNLVWNNNNIPKPVKPDKKPNKKVNKK